MSDRTFLGNPCKRGHEGSGGQNLRYRVNGACVQCTAEDLARRKTRAKQAALEAGATLGIKEAT